MGSDETSTSLLRRIGRRVGRRIGEELAMPPRRCEERYRHELKYLISYGQKADLNVRMAPLLDHDSHARDGSYTTAACISTITGTPPTKKKWTAC